MIPEDYFETAPKVLCRQRHAWAKYGSGSVVSDWNIKKGESV